MESKYIKDLWLIENKKIKKKFIKSFFSFEALKTNNKINNKINYKYITCNVYKELQKFNCINIESIKLYKNKDNIKFIYYEKEYSSIIFMLNKTNELKIDENVFIITEYQKEYNFHFGHNRVNIKKNNNDYQYEFFKEDCFFSSKKTYKKSSSKSSSEYFIIYLDENSFNLKKNDSGYTLKYKKTGGANTNINIEIDLDLNSINNIINIKIYYQEKEIIDYKTENMNKQKIDKIFEELDLVELKEDIKINSHEKEFINKISYFLPLQKDYHEMIKYLENENIINIDN